MKVFQKMRFNLTVNSILTILIGILLIIHPGQTGRFIALVTGIVVLIAGVVDILRYVSPKQEEAPSVGSLILGIIKAVLGVFVLTHTGSLLIVLSYIMSIFVLVCGVGCLEGALKLRRAGLSGNGVSLILAILVILAGLFMLFYPFRAVATAIIIVGILLVLVGAVGLYISFQVRRIP